MIKRNLSDILRLSKKADWQSVQKGHAECEESMAIFPLSSI